jgi:hypothetical protein
VRIVYSKGVDERVVVDIECSRECVFVIKERRRDRFAEYIVWSEESGLGQSIVVARGAGGARVCSVVCITSIY